MLCLDMERQLLFASSDFPFLESLFLHSLFPYAHAAESDSLVIQLQLGV